MAIKVKGRVLPSWGGHSKAVRVQNQDEWERWNQTEGVTTKAYYERDKDGQKRPSVYLNARMASQVAEGDIVELVVETRDTKRGRNLRLVSIDVLEKAPQPNDKR